MLFRNAEAEVMECLRVELPGPEQGAAGNAGVDDIAAVIAGIVPAAMIGQGARLAAGGAVGAVGVAGGVVVAVAEVDRAAAALTGVAAYRDAECVGVGVLADRQRKGALAAELDAERAGIA